MLKLWPSLLCALLLIAAAHAQSVLPARHLMPEDLDRLPAIVPTIIEAYGTDPLQFGELRIPRGPGPFPVAVIIHGGCWIKGLATQTYMSPFATALTARGIATWNIEYRQLGDNGSGWPGTFLDWAAATDHLQELARRYPLDLSRVLTVGHSAGATASLWLAARGRLPLISAVRGGNPLKISAVVAIDGPGDLRTFIGRDQEICGKPVVSQFMGGLPSKLGPRYAEADPIEMLPSGVPTIFISSHVILPEAAEAYRKTATEKGDTVEVVSLRNAGHFDMLSPRKSSGIVVQDLIVQALDLKQH